MKKHPQRGVAVLGFIEGKWRRAYHLGTEKPDGSMNYFVKDPYRYRDNKVLGCHWLKPDQVKPIPPRRGQ